MDDDDRELVQRLFVAATEKVETAHDVAIAGQSKELTARGYADVAGRLRAAARDLAALAEAAMIVANLGIDQHRKQSKRSR